MSNFRTYILWCNHSINIWKDWNMQSVTLKLNPNELQEIIQAYQTIQSFLEKVISPNELYQTSFLKGVKQAVKEVKSGDYEEVESFDDFIA